MPPSEKTIAKNEKAAVSDRTSFVFNEQVAIVFLGIFGTWLPQRGPVVLRP